MISEGEMLSIELVLLHNEIIPFIPLCFHSHFYIYILPQSMICLTHRRLKNQ